MNNSMIGGKTVVDLKSVDDMIALFENGRAKEDEVRFCSNSQKELPGKDKGMVDASKLELMTDSEKD